MKKPKIDPEQLQVLFAISLGVDLTRHQRELVDDLIARGFLRPRVVVILTPKGRRMVEAVSQLEKHGSRLLPPVSSEGEAANSVEGYPRDRPSRKSPRSG